MSIYSRDYMRDENSRKGGSGPGSWSVITWLIVINCSVFLAEHLSRLNEKAWLALSDVSILQGRVYQFLTYQFSHAHLLHLLFNMVGVFFIGRMLLRLVGPRKTVWIYLLAGLFGGAVQLGYNFLTGSAGSPIVGASASLMGMLGAAATVIPRERINFLLFFILPVSMTMLQIVLIVIAVNVVTFGLQLVSGPRILPDGTASSTAVLAHLGGLGMGWIFIRHLQNFFSNFGISIVPDSEQSPKPKKKKEKKQKDKAKTPSASDVDAILDKISEKGMHSLTKKEREILDAGSEQLASRNKK